LAALDSDVLGESGYDAMRYFLSTEYADNDAAAVITQYLVRLRSHSERVCLTKFDNAEIIAGALPEPDEFTRTASRPVT
jgi:hypothetical protein